MLFAFIMHPLGFSTAHLSTDLGCPNRLGQPREYCLQLKEANNDITTKLKKGFAWKSPLVAFLSRPCAEADSPAETAANRPNPW